MTFPNLTVLPLGIAIALLVVVAEGRHAGRRRQLAAFLGGRRAVDRLSRSNLYRSRWERVSLLVLATLAVTGAATDVRWRERDRVPSLRSSILAIDVSASMQASDVSPTRLARAVEVADELIQALETDPVGLLIFAGDAYVLAPPTREHAAVRYYLAGVTPTMASAHDPGTLLSVGIRAAAGLWTTEAEPGEERSIIMIGDGEAGENEEAVLAEVRAAADRGIRIHAVGVGTPEGSGMTMTAAAYQLGGPVLDASGAPAVSTVNEALLQRVAGAGGGRYVHAADGDGLSAFEDRLRVREVPGPWWMQYDPVTLLVLVALVGLVVESLLDVRLPGRRAFAIRSNA
jgi:Ca-activated chloride channel family protein